MYLLCTKILKLSNEIQYLYFLQLTFELVAFSKNESNGFHSFKYFIEKILRLEG